MKQDAQRLWLWTAVAAQSQLILAIHAVHLVRLGTRAAIWAGLQALAFTGKVQTTFVERANLILRQLIAHPPAAPGHWFMISIPFGCIFNGEGTGLQLSANNVEVNTRVLLWVG
ncbi:MAG: hypothetical protein KJ069_30485, partial [Anaerolineae bacterium]|nr:hypothetical protein [Anaerolineae bacterium]